MRYYYAEDAQVSQDIAATLNGEARDFTGYSPKPPRRTVEIWLAGEPASGSGQASTARSTNRELSNEMRDLRNLWKEKRQQLRSLFE